VVLLATIWMQMSNWHEYDKINPKLFSLYPCLSRLPSTFSSGTVPLERSREDCSPGHFISGIRAPSFWERAGADHPEDGFTNSRAARIGKT